jgi:predicted PurR-regulated permease PerM
MSTQKVLKRKKGDGVIIKNFPGYFLIFCIAVSGWFLINVFRPFFTILILAAILATAFYPLYRKLLKIFKVRARFASITMCFLVIVLIVVPLVLFILLLGRQAFDTYSFIQEQVHNGVLDPYIQWQSGGMIYDSLAVLRNDLGLAVDLNSLDIKAGIIETAQIVSSWLAGQSAAILKGFGGLLLSFFILIFALYYFFKDGVLIVKKIMILSPLPKEYEFELFKKFKEISLATLYGIFLTSIVQGIIGGIGFVIAGIPNALFWGTAIAAFSLVPVVGTSLVWLPASVLMIVTGHLQSGIFLFLWGLLIVSTVDNFLRAFLIGGKTKTNQLLTFLAVFGGIGMFGLVGVIFGPLILTLFFTFLHIYELEYDSVLHRDN